ncbi:ABC-type branched-subunit amino acid transport system substrate-binding protein [Devosia subaequoris]|uniref:ABC-type branched-subunit amino acid transport system substrate-binding protein n=1 Tax=Devosia subaequoris TaxID=395930 RepID=A0A7W6INH9_9HYPH|nr:penicillin-binding protein activator [Devosia subaequoris]MBB4052371.1 ABC-type branched-subunit amino acid transport system substrate-binding protein [Devosia subaequoris]MCP1209531.1 penicillin-binding protein activator [Devosia subaequoris]
MGDQEARWSRRAAMVGLASALAACSPGTLQWGSRSFSLPWTGNGTSNGGLSPIASAPREQFGRGRVNVALLLPLSGNVALSQLGTALANASKLAIGFIEANPNIGENITISLRDTGDSAAGATSAANAAVAEGAQLILGPVTAEQVTAAGQVARAANIPLIGFANNSAVAMPGVYVLNILPETEMKRAVRYLRDQGRRGPAGIFPATPYGEALATAFRQQAIAAGFNPSAVYTFSDISEAQQIVDQARPLIERGAIDSLVMPDRASAATFASLLAQAGATTETVQLVGSADWANDSALLRSPALTGAIFPAVDEAGLNAIRADYAARFGSNPPQMATIAYTATILANVNTLSLATPPYEASLITNPAGFAGRDGLFRLHANGRSDYALVIKQIAAGGATRAVDGAKI